MTRARRQAGAATIEFAITGPVFLLLLFATIEFGRVMLLWSTATEATRLGARTAVVCSANAAQIRTRMQTLLPILTNAQIDVTYTPAGCAAGTCTSVTVAIAGGTEIPTTIPFLATALTFPRFATTLPIEGMNSTNNPACA